MSDCNHMRWVHPEPTWEENWRTGEEELVEQDSYQESTLEDLDTHRMKCSMCDGIEYYSGRAKSYYEDGESAEGLFPNGR